MLRVLTVAAIACGFATTAFAQGVNLAWSDCGADGTENRAFACGSNSGTNPLVATVVAPQALTRFVGIDVVMDLISQSDPLPAWWDLVGGTGCRPTSLSMSTDFSGTPSGGANCEDVFLGGGGGGVGRYGIAEGGITNRARIVAFWAVPDERALSTNETYMFRMVINNQNTTTCAGCADPVCIVLNMIRLAQPAGVGDFEVSGAPTGGRDYVTWQGPGANCATVPTKNRTWGQVKSLYR
jgi:hypothetical protein